MNPRFYQQPFGRLLDDQKKIGEFKSQAKTYHVASKRRATMGAVREWIKYKNPSQYYACWGSDSAGYKDDSVQVWYLD